MDAIECFCERKNPVLIVVSFLYPALFYQSLLVKSTVISQEPILSKILRFECAKFRLLVKNRKHGAHFKYPV